MASAGFVRDPENRVGVGPAVAKRRGESVIPWQGATAEGAPSDVSAQLLRAGVAHGSFGTCVRGGYAQGKGPRREGRAARRPGGLALSAFG